MPQRHLLELLYNSFLSTTTFKTICFDVTKASKISEHFAASAPPNAINILVQHPR